MYTSQLDLVVPGYFRMVRIAFLTLNTAIKSAIRDKISEQLGNKETIRQ
jgi:hypothetical protein